jgi:hypothetical protein
MSYLLDLSEKKLYWDIKFFHGHNETKSPSEVTMLGPFLQCYTSLQSSKSLASKSTHARVAILDDGVDQTSPVWAEMSKAGYERPITSASFIIDREGNESP